ncbi:hypothetical protein CSUB01_09949 [Colletotrichum sublineola]|uniref:Uncharacterized protein n=1 Tax=Colletotrichum sublineola TaxID=1173701 RepID=A0A066XIN3_COLSU|nr:hypothetical protein CSUB01_09949 [Colletotrichum sublineola]
MNPLELVLHQWNTLWEEHKTRPPSFDKDSLCLLIDNKLKKQNPEGYALYKQHEAGVAAAKEAKRKKREARRLEKEKEKESANDQKGDPVPPINDEPPPLSG